jgi:hypothetical protein
MFRKPIVLAGILIVVVAVLMTLVLTNHQNVPTSGIIVPKTPVYKTKKSSKSTKQKTSTSNPNIVSGTQQATTDASDYITAAYSLSYTILIAPKTGWTVSATNELPYVTPSHRAQIIALQKAAIANKSEFSTQTKQIISGRERWDVKILASNIVSNAPHTSTSELAQVEFTVTEYGVGLPTNGKTSTVQVAQLKMQKVNGVWLVAQQLAQNEN